MAINARISRTLEVLFYCIHIVEFSNNFKHQLKCIILLLLSIIIIQFEIKNKNSNLL